MSTAFDQRVMKSREAVDRFDDYLTLHNIPYAKTGYEEWVSHGDFVRSMKAADDRTAKFIRFFPDRCIGSELAGVHLVEVKHSNCIEKEAYDIYMSLACEKRSVGIVFLHDDMLLFCRIEALVLQKAHSDSIPIVDGKWYAPRQLPDDQYLQWKQRSSGSGTTYGFVDFDATPFVYLKEK